ncbi:MAG TPA: hypothetical protein VFO91_05365 [Anaerolineales bacterium]|nr:hypothetical protein [Anaerolineales bacterium]
MEKAYGNIFTLRSNGGSGDSFLNPRTRSGKTILANAPLFDDNRKLTGAQKTDPAAVREAAIFASFAGTQEAYINQAKKTGMTAYYMALADWFGAPRVWEINVDGWDGEIGQTIRVKARDNVMVARVSVVIRDAEENVLEMGEAVQSQAGSPWWNYTTKSIVKMTPFPSIEATAQDLPGNTDSFIIS